MSAFYELVRIGWLIVWQVTTALFIGAFCGAWLWSYFGMRKVGLVVGILIGVAGCISRFTQDPHPATKLRAWLYEYSPYLPAPLCAVLVLAVAGVTSLGTYWLTGSNTVAGLAGIAGAILGSWSIVNPENIKAKILWPFHGNVFGRAGYQAQDETDGREDIGSDPSQGLWMGWRNRVVYVAGRHWWKGAKRVIQKVPTVYTGVLSMLVCMPPRTGKFTCSIAMILLLNRIQNKVTIDPKGQAWFVTAKAQSQLGFEPVNFDAFGMDKNIPTRRINVLGGLDLDHPNFIPHVTSQAKCQVSVMPGDGNRFFPETAQGLGTGLAVCVREFYGVDASWPLVNKILHSPMGVLNRFWDRCKTESRFEIGRQMGNRWHKPIGEDGQPIGSLSRSDLDVLSTLRKSLEYLAVEPIAYMLSGTPEETFSFRNNRDSRYAVYLMMEENMAKQFGKVNKLILTELKDANMTLPLPKYRTVILADEVATSLDQEVQDLLCTIVNLAPGYGMNVVLYFQSIAQGRNMLKDKGFDELRGGIGCALVAGANENMTVEFLQKEIGQQTVWVPSTNPTAEFGVDGSTTARGADLATVQDMKDWIDNGKLLAITIGSGRPMLLDRWPHYYQTDVVKIAGKDPYVRAK